MGLRKYSSSKIDTAVANILRQQKPKANFGVEDSETSVTLLLFHKNKLWEPHTKAIGAIVLLRNTDKVPMRQHIYFDLFYEQQDLKNFWDLHKKQFKFIEIEKHKIKKLSDCSKEQTAAGKECEDNDVSEWTLMYALTAFADRGWATEEELSDCVNQANILAAILSLEETEICPPKDDGIEINFIVREKRNES